MQYKIIKEIGTLSKKGDVEVRLNYMSWENNTPKYDLRTWINGKPFKGVVLDIAELKEINRVVSELNFAVEKEVQNEVEGKTEEKVEIKTDDISKGDVVSSLVSLPANDCNYDGALKSATKEELYKAIDIMNNNGGRNKGRISKCRGRITEITIKEMMKKTFDKSVDTRSKSENSVSVKSKTIIKTPTKKTKSPTKQTSKEKEKSDNILIFPKAKPEVVELPETHNGHTYEECKAKLDKEREKFKDGDSQYVIDGLLEVCRTSDSFCDNVMREDKSYEGGFKYMTKCVKDGYCVKYAGVSYLDNNLALALFIDYFNSDEAATEEKNKKQNKSVKEA